MSARTLNARFNEAHALEPVHNKPENVKITQALLNSACLAHRRYLQCLAKEKKDTEARLKEKKEKEKEENRPKAAGVEQKNKNIKWKIEELEKEVNEAKQRIKKKGILLKI